MIVLICISDLKYDYHFFTTNFQIMKKQLATLLTSRTSRLGILTTLVLLTAHTVQAEPVAGTLTTALESTATAIKNYFEPVSKIMLYMMAIVGAITAVPAYAKFSGGDPETRKQIQNWFAALIFAGLVLITLRAIFF